MSANEETCAADTPPASPQPHPAGGEPPGGFRMEPLYWLLAAVPLAVALRLLGAGPVWVFLVSGLAIIPLAGLMGRATENLAETLGAAVGALLNATFGNAAELIIGLMVLRKGPALSPSSRHPSPAPSSVTSCWCWGCPSWPAA